MTGFRSLSGRTIVNAMTGEDVIEGEPLEVLKASANAGDVAAVTACALLVIGDELHALQATVEQLGRRK
jgi:hypothetical protein